MRRRLPSRGTGPDRPLPRRLTAALFLGALLLSAPAAEADIYRWEDSQGSIHFTDDIQSIPPEQRDKARLHIREAPGAAEPLPPPTALPGIGPGAGPSPGAGEEAEPAADREREELLSRIEQLEAKIAAKENHIEAVDRKRSLAINPLGNKFVDPPDLELYSKYQAELPGDREELRRLVEEYDRVK